MKATVIPAVIIILVLILTVGHFVGVERYFGLDVSGADLGYPRSIVDSAGNNITIYKPLERIIVTNSDAAEAVRVVGAKGRVIGATDSLKWYPTFFPEMSKLPEVGKWSAVDSELVLQLDADCILAYTSDPSPEYLEDKLPPTIKVIRSDYFKPETLREEMLKLGYILDVEENTSEYIEWYDNYVDEINAEIAAIPADERQIVYLNNNFDDAKTERKTYARKSGGISILCEEAGGINIAADSMGSYPIVSMEYVYEEDPDVVLGLSYRGGFERDDNTQIKKEYEDILELPGFDKLKAVEDECVFIIDGTVAYSPAYPCGLTQVAKWFYPDKFGNLNPEVMLQEYVDNFCDGLDYNVSEHGVFYYPD
ncbi:MAG: ABC transporter substrate-binding protein [Methanosarcinales archaeon]